MVQINVGVWIVCFRGCLGALAAHKKKLKPLSYLPGNKQIVRTSWYDRNVRLIGIVTEFVITVFFLPFPSLNSHMFHVLIFHTPFISVPFLWIIYFQWFMNSLSPLCFLSSFYISHLVSCKLQAVIWPSVFCQSPYLILSQLFIIWPSVIQHNALSNTAMWHASYKFVLCTHAYSRIPLPSHCWFLTMSHSAVDVPLFVHH
jgi:hypothetical protein